MRLIDADAFERAVMFSDDEDLQDVIYRLRDFPTIEPERKKGRWIMAVGTSGIRRSKCSECGKYYPHDPEFPFNVPSEYNYCPNCGAYMGE